MTYLLDTNVVSQFGKRQPNVNLLRWMRERAEAELCISVLTLRELRYGAERARRLNHPEAESIGAQTRALAQAYAGRILPVDPEVAVAWAGMLARSNKHVDDTGLAATAAVHGLVVVTRNIHHLRGRGVALLDPFRFPAALTDPAI